VAREDGAAVFELAGRAVESGYDLRLVVRELSRLMRDLLVIGVDPSRLTDPEIAAESERERLQALAGRFSAEDLMRAFDVLTKAEVDIRGSMQPRYQLEMALLRLIHLRKLVPLSDLIDGLEKGAAPRTAAPPRPSPPPAPPKPASTTAATVRAVESRPKTEAATAGNGSPAAAPSPALSGPALKDAFLAEIQKLKKFFYGTVVAQAHLEFEADRVVFRFGPQHRALRQQLDQMRTWLEELATRLAGHRMSVVGADAAGAPSGKVAQAGRGTDAPKEPEDRQSALKQQALSDAGVQAMLDVFAAEIKEVEER
jgi:DNA polymerase-3 subunit gamma/tau